jgi:hypothetical protein
MPVSRDKTGPILQPNTFANSPATGFGRLSRDLRYQYSDYCLPPLSETHVQLTVIYSLYWSFTPSQVNLHVSKSCLACHIFIIHPLIRVTRLSSSSFHTSQRTQNAAGHSRSNSRTTEITCTKTLQLLPRTPSATLNSLLRQKNLRF